MDNPSCQHLWEGRQKLEKEGEDRQKTEKEARYKEEKTEREIDKKGNIRIFKSYIEYLLLTHGR